MWLYIFHSTQKYQRCSFSRSKHQYRDLPTSYDIHLKFPFCDQTDGWKGLWTHLAGADYAYCNNSTLISRGCIQEVFIAHIYSTTTAKVN
jgi:hypothetical protein